MDGDIAVLVSDFENNIATSRNLADDAKSFVKDIKGIVSGNQPRMEIIEVVKTILNREPDATLRKRLEDLVERVEMARGDIDLKTILVQVLA